MWLGPQCVATSARRARDAAVCTAGAPQMHAAGLGQSNVPMCAAGALPPCASVKRHAACASTGTLPHASPCIAMHHHASPCIAMHRHASPCIATPHLSAQAFGRCILQVVTCLSHVKLEKRRKPPSRHDCGKSPWHRVQFQLQCRCHVLLRHHPCIALTSHCHIDATLPTATSVPCAAPSPSLHRSHFPLPHWCHVLLSPSLSPSLSPPTEPSPWTGTYKQGPCSRQRPHVRMCMPKAPPNA